MRIASTPKSSPNQAVSAWQLQDGLLLAAILGTAIALRLLFHAGFFGSDEITYLQAAYKIALGDWSVSNYVGATRYGMNLPTALAIRIFGLSEFSANLWTFSCSIAEVALIFVVAHRLFDRRTAVLSAALLALLPLHVHIAGRMSADPPLALFLTLSVALVLLAAQTRSARLYVAAGLAWGAVFWVKEGVSFLYLPVLLLLTLYRTRGSGPWPWIFAGIAAALLANGALMALIAGDPMHVLTVMKTSMGRFATETPETSPWYYLRYLFLDLRHTLALGFLALAGLFVFLRSRAQRDNPNVQFVVLWCVLMLGMFSFAVVSFSPITLVSKQTNYMAMFFAPMALLGAWFLASLRQRVLVPLAVIVVCGSITLSALEQQAVTAFTANSKAAYRFLRDTPSAFLYGSTNNYRAMTYYALLEQRPEVPGRVAEIKNATRRMADKQEASTGSNSAGPEVFALLDLQNNDWGGGAGRIRTLADVPKCWRPSGILNPAELGHGSRVVSLVLAFAARLPDPVATRAIAALKPVSTPASAHLFRIDASCLDASVN